MQTVSVIKQLLNNQSLIKKYDMTTSSVVDCHIASQMTLCWMKADPQNWHFPAKKDLIYVADAFIMKISQWTRTRCLHKLGAESETTVSWHFGRLTFFYINLWFPFTTDLHPQITCWWEHNIHLLCVKSAWQTKSVLKDTPQMMLNV